MALTDGFDLLLRDYLAEPDHASTPVIGACECGRTHRQFFLGDMAKVKGELWTWWGGWKPEEGLC